MPILFDKFHHGRPARHSEAMREAITDAEFLEDADVSGVGLGLYLAHNVMERMGGHISVDSEVGRGATYNCTCPCGLTELATSSTSRRAPMAKQLLVVDDDPSLLLAVSETLRAESYDVQTARRGSDAMIRVAESVPDLIISDIRMPGMDGYALLRNLRSSPRTRLVPVIFLTAKDETADRIAGFRTGVDAYVTKPFEPEELIAVVKMSP